MIAKRSNIALVLSAATLIMHLAGNAHYGFFRDELYFIICGRHPQFGYVDQPPLVPLLSALTQLFGPSLFSLRAIPAILAAASVYTTCLLVREFGGRAFAQLVAGICVAFAPVLAQFGVLMYPDSVQTLAWPLVALLIVRISKGADPRTFLVAGLVTGIAIESKYSILKLSGFCGHFPPCGEGSIHGQKTPSLLLIGLPA